MLRAETLHEVPALRRSRESSWLSPPSAFSVGTRPVRAAEDDLQSITTVMSYGGGGASKSKAESNSTSATSASGDAPDFKKMTQQEKLEWNRQKWDRILGSTRH